MSKYINFTKEQKQQAHNTDIAELLRSRGEILKRSGSEYQWRDGSEKVTIRGNLWFHQYDQEGGDAVSFAKRFFGMSYAEAIECLLEGSGDIIHSSPAPAKETKPFTMPKRNDNMRRVYGYLLNRRKIDVDVLNEFVRNKLIYESADYHNAVFVGRDNDGMARHIHKRGTYSDNAYKGNAGGSIPEFSFHWNGTSNRIFLFEAPIDMLSFISMNKDNWQQHTYAAACSVSDRVLFQCLQDNPNIDEVYLCLDNDKAGHLANERISQKLREQGIQARILVPVHKDWNEDLVSNQTLTEDEPEPAPFKMKMAL